VTITSSAVRGADVVAHDAGLETPSLAGAADVGPSRHVGSGWRRVRLLAAILLPPAGAVLILLSYHHAAGLAEPDDAQFALYWAGYLGGMLPLVALACATRIDGVTRSSALAGIGLFGMVPTVLRGPSGPLSSDEFAHLRQAIETSLHGDVGHVSHLLPITQEFPGLHQAVSAFARLTGLSLWHAGMIVIVLAHILTVLAVYQLVRAVCVSPPGAAAGAVVYTLNPSWAYFDTSVSYESLALPMLLWFLAAAVAASRARKRSAAQYIAVIVLCAAALPMIHHLTTIVLCVILLLLIVVGILRRRRGVAAVDSSAPGERLWPLLLSASCLATSIAFWWSNKYEWLVAYLSPALTRGGTQLGRLVGLAEQAPAESSGERAVFSGAENPIYEIVSGFLFPAIALALFLASLAVLWRNRHGLGSAPWAFAVVGAMYFLSIPMVLTKGGAEGAHRSWAFSFIGLAVLCGLAVGRATAGRAGNQKRWSRRRFGIGAVIVGIALSIMTIGSATLGSNVSARFPGSPNVGDDTRSVSQEGAAVTAWMEARTPVDTPVVADRYVSQQVGSVGRMATLAPGDAFPMWDFYLNAAPVRPDVVKQVLDAGIRYFVVDARMATTRPRLGYWFTVDEPGVDGTDPFPQSAIDRFNCLPWLRAVYAAGPLTVYEVDPDVLRRTMAGSCERQDS
jgi:hypothetical protein